MNNTYSLCFMVKTNGKSMVLNSSKIQLGGWHTRRAILLHYIDNFKKNKLSNLKNASVYYIFIYLKITIFCFYWNNFLNLVYHDWHF